MTRITISGRAVGDADVKFTPTGDAVATFTVAENRRKKSPQGEWVDDGASFYRCQAWRALGESCGEKITKGALVVVIGDLRQRDYETRDGEKRSTWEVQCDEVALALPKWAQKGAGWNQSSNWNPPPPAQKSDPWAGTDPEIPF